MRPACPVSSNAHCRPGVLQTSPGMGRCPLMWARGNVGSLRVPSSGVVGVAVEWGSWRGRFPAGGTRERKLEVQRGAS